MIQSKFQRLREIIKELGSALIVYSGGVDSTFLLKVAYDVIGEQAVAFTATSPTYPRYELEDAIRFANNIGSRHIIVESNELEIPQFRENTPRRCFYCKNELFDKAKHKAKELGLQHILDGTNYDDLRDYRPGREAAKNHGVKSPLLEAGLTKSEIRNLSKSLGIQSWNKPSFACLSSRFPYGIEINEDRLKRVFKCEELLRTLGFSQYRVRYHNETARIEINTEEFSRIIQEPSRSLIINLFKEQGFVFITIDIEGYRTGSLNESLLPDTEKNLLK